MCSGLGRTIKMSAINDTTVGSEYQNATDIYFTFGLEGKNEGKNACSRTIIIKQTFYPTIKTPIWGLPPTVTFFGDNLDTVGDSLFKCYTILCVRSMRIYQYLIR